MYILFEFIYYNTVTMHGPMNIKFKETNKLYILKT